MDRRVYQKLNRPVAASREWKEVFRGEVESVYVRLILQHQGQGTAP